MSDYKNSLEFYIAEKLKEIDPYARPTRGSGCGNEIGDISNDYYYIECKIKGTHKNIIMDYNKDYLKLINDIPVNTQKEVFIAIENKYGEKFICMESEAFFRLLYKAHKIEE